MTGEFVSAELQSNGKWVVIVRLSFQGRTYLHATEFEPIPALILSAPQTGTVIKPETP